jgi:hypothetical protein
VEHKDENIIRDIGVLCFAIIYYMIHHYKETEDCNQEGIEKKQQNSNGFHLGRII